MGQHDKGREEAKMTTTDVSLLLPQNYLPFGSLCFPQTRQKRGPNSSLGWRIPYLLFFFPVG